MLRSWDNVLRIDINIGLVFLPQNVLGESNSIVFCRRKVAVAVNHVEQEVCSFRNNRLIKVLYSVKKSTTCSQSELGWVPKGKIGFSPGCSSKVAIFYSLTATEKKILRHYYIWTNITCGKGIWMNRETLFNNHDKFDSFYWWWQRVEWYCMVVENTIHGSGECKICKGLFRDKNQNGNKTDSNLHNK